MDLDTSKHYSVDVNNYIVHTRAVYTLRTI